jgi:hypothetical protein
MAAMLYSRLSEMMNGEFCQSVTPWPPLKGVEPGDSRDRVLTLLAIYDLHTAPLDRIGDRARWAAHPIVNDVKMRLETQWLQELGAAAQPLMNALAADPVRAMRALAAKDRLPAVYRWVGDEATLPELRTFLAIEGGPDGGFDDLVATCQVGLSGAPKMELARNYWDEMGNGDPADVHTDLHRRMAAVVEIPDLPREELPTPALQRAAFGGLLATNRWLQPEMIGALGLTELQAGPRCRLVLKAFERLAIPAEAHTFYQVHADVDPRHGKDWLDQAVAPLAQQQPSWAPRMIRGAAWRWLVNADLFDSLKIPQRTGVAA